MIVVEELVELTTAWGPMRTHVVKPAAAGKYPGIVFYSEIFQVTGPIARTATMLAGHGYIVAIPEIYHEFEAAGEVFPYNQAGTDRGNVLKTTKELASYDADARAVLDHLAGRPDCTGQLGGDGDLHWRAPGLSGGVESGCSGDSLFLCDGSSHALAG